MLKYVEQQYKKRLLGKGSQIHKTLKVVGHISYFTLALYQISLLGYPQSGYFTVI